MSRRGLRQNGKRKETSSGTAKEGEEAETVSNIDATTTRACHAFQSCYPPPAPGRQLESGLVAASVSLVLRTGTKAASMLSAKRRPGTERAGMLRDNQARRKQVTDLLSQGRQR